MKNIIAPAMLGITLLTASFASVAVTAAKSEKHAGDAVEYRQAILQLVKSNVGIMGAMAKGQVPLSAETLEKNATRIEQLSLMMNDYFSVDTSKFSVDTEALPAIWKDYPDFQTKITALTEAAANLKMAAASGNEGQLKANIGAVFKSCKGCHDSYKAE
ncbi:cytochrome c [Aliiglaciecola sp. SL4]|uniref:c-type cytochrome n=1 Tax=Aliiglaciecola sp. SL4 TaxID=3239806 RepID=UPI00355B1B37